MVGSQKPQTKLCHYICQTFSVENWVEIETILLYDKWDTILVDLLFVTFFLSEKVKSLTCLIPYMSPERGRMEGLLVLKEETVATSLAGLVCDPSAFIVEEYSEEVGGPHRFG